MDINNPGDVVGFTARDNDENDVNNAETIINQPSLMNEVKFRICMSEVKMFLPSITKLLLIIVFFIPFLVLMSMFSGVIASGIVIVLGI